MLKCVKNFNEGGLVVLAGEEYEGVNADYLLSNFPAYFVKVEAVAVPTLAEADVPAEFVDAVVEEVKDFTAPPADKAIKAPRARK